MKHFINAIYIFVLGILLIIYIPAIFSTSVDDEISIFIMAIAVALIFLATAIAISTSLILQELRKLRKNNSQHSDKTSNKQ